MILPLRYEPIECNVSRPVPAYLAFANIIPHPNLYNWKMLTFRLLSGNLDIKCGITQDVIKARQNYAIIGAPKRRCPGLMGAYIDFDNIQPRFERYINRIDPNNNSFYAEIFMEVSRYYFAVHDRNSLSAFLQTYRILEKISIVLPLMWAGYSKNYAGAFKSLRAYFNDDAVGEMKVFKRFIDDLIDPTIKAASANFNFTSLDPNWRQRNFDTMERLCAKLKIVPATAPPSLISVKNEDLLPILIAFRNKYFHRLTGANDSFGYSEIPDPDSMFHDLNETFSEWLFFLICHVIALESKNS